MSMDEFLGIEQGNKTLNMRGRKLQSCDCPKVYQTYSKHSECKGNRYTEEVAIRDQIFRGTSNDKLREDALAKEHTVEDLVMKGQGYEQSRVNSKAMAGKPLHHAVKLRFPRFL